MDEYARFCAAELDGLARYAMALAGERQAAHDLLADSLVTIRLQWRRVSRAERPIAYARRIVTNRFLSERRSWAGRRIRLSSTGELPDPGLPDPTVAVDDRQLLIGLLAGLPGKQRAAVVLRYLLDLPDQEIAAELRCSTATVRSHVSQGLAALRVTAAHDTRTRK